MDGLLFQLWLFLVVLAVVVVLIRDVLHVVTEVVCLLFFVCGVFVVGCEFLLVSCVEVFGVC